MPTPLGHLPKVIQRPTETVMISFTAFNYSSYGSYRSAVEHTIKECIKAETECVRLALSEYLNRPVTDIELKQSRRLMGYWGYNGYALIYDKVPMGVITRIFSAEKVTIQFSPGKDAITKLFGRYPMAQVNTKNLKDWY